jgi:transglutaminase-like putative cysteine protease
MKNNTWRLFFAGMLVLVVILSGCELVFPPTTYEATPTKISYDISYGYRVNSSGTGLYEITYWCDTPEALVGTTTYNLLYNHEYQTKTLGNNTFIHWNISRKDEQTFELGITAQMEVDSYLVADLNGEDALTIVEINDKYPEIVNQYTRVQGNETIRFIDPFNPNITAIADAVLISTKTNNSFLLAKSLFAWLKQNIIYQTHPDEGGVRPAAVTLHNKNGDCDDLSFLYVSLCRALGIPARFIRGYLLTYNNNGTITATAHAWVEVFVGGLAGLKGWIPIECACITSSIEIDINQNFGVESAFHLRLFTDNGDNESLASSLSGISYIIHEPNRTIKLQSFAEIRNYRELESKKLVITSKNTRHYE